MMAWILLLSLDQPAVAVTHFVCVPVARYHYCFSMCEMVFNLDQPDVGTYAIARLYLLFETREACIEYICRIQWLHLSRFWQVVLTSTNPSELCINGMSFSRRSSRWANAALVITVSPKDFSALSLNGPLAGVEFQVPFEVIRHIFLSTSCLSFVLQKFLDVDCANIHNKG